MHNHVKLIATSAMGLEAIVGREVRQLGYDPIIENGKIIYEGPVEAIAKSNLWLRVADRVKLVVGEGNVESFDALYEMTKTLPWEQFIPEDGNFPVIGKSHQSKLYSVPDCQAIVKKAIVDRLKWKHGVANKMPETGALYRVEVAILKDIATLTIDTSGDGLHKRGYRTGQGEAPIKETLAAALVSLTNWRSTDPFIDPFCGSGTIPIEAAMIGQNIAPGFNRDFASMEWDIIPQKIWDDVLDEADSLAKYDEPISIHGSDIDHKMIELSKANAMEAGLSDLIQFKQMQVADLTIKDDRGYLVGNPPYGERLKDQDYVAYLYETIGKIMAKHPGWSVYILTAFKAFEKAYGKKATKRRKLFNGFIETQYYQYFGK